MFVVASWNSRALIHFRESAQRKKPAMLHEFGAKAQIVHLQELHGTENQARRALRETLPHHHILVPMHDDSSTGLGATLVAKQTGGKDTMIVSEELIQGRVLRTSITVEECVMVHYNVRNFDCEEAAIRRVARHMAVDRERAAAAPSECAVWVSSGWNFLATGDKPRHVDASLEDVAVFVAMKDGQRAWQAALSHFTDMQHDMQTHYDKASAKVSRLDRIYAGAPGWALLGMRLMARPCMCPMQVRQSGLSDRAPLLLTITRERHRRAGLIPNQATAKSPRFAHHVAILERAARLDLMHITERIDAHKDILHDDRARGSSGAVRPE